MYIKNKNNIFLIGPMGAGKSTVGKQLAKELKMVFFDSDKEIENITGVDINWIFDKEGELGFRKREEQIIINLTKKDNIVLATGGGSIKSNLIRNLLKEKGIVIYLETTIEAQLYRTKKNKNRPLLNNKNLSNKEILEKLALERNHLYEEISDITVKSSEKNVKFITNQIICILKKY